MVCEASSDIAEAFIDMDSFALRYNNHAGTESQRGSGCAQVGNGTLATSFRKEIRKYLNKRCSHITLQYPVKSPQR